MHSSPVSPPPFMVGMAKSSWIAETGVVEVLNYAAVVDCGIPINPALARVQVEGGIVQGIGHTLMEDVTRTAAGRIRESSLFTYRLPTRLDTGASTWNSRIRMDLPGRSARNLLVKSLSIPPHLRSLKRFIRATGVWHRAVTDFAGTYPASETGGITILCDYLHIQPGLTAIIGGGGKTTLLRVLANELSAQARVIVGYQHKDDDAGVVSGF